LDQKQIIKDLWLIELFCLICIMILLLIKLGGYEIDVNKFYEKLEELEKMSEKKIKNMIEKMGYFTLP
jgi:uncharacterized protein YneF (UPF0154 family)